MAILNKDDVTLSQWLQHILLQILQYQECIIYKYGPDLHITDWLSHNNYEENKDQEIERIRFSMSTISMSINMPACTSLQNIQIATHEGRLLQELKVYIIQG